MIVPDIGEEKKQAAAVFAGAVVLALLAWWIFGADSSRTDRALVSAGQEVERAQRRGTAIDHQIQLQSQANEYIRRQVEELQDRHGLQPIPPFIQAEKTNTRVHHLKTVYDIIKEQLESMARARSIDQFDASMGFTFSAQPPELGQVPYWLTMLQLTTKAAYVALACPYGNISDVSFGKVDLNSEVLTGPVGRPALLREYPFEMQITGSLRSILWLIHQLSMEGDHSKELERFRGLLREITTKVDKVIPTGVASDTAGNVASPLIVRGITVESGNLLPTDQLTQLTVTLQLAGMEFLSAEERFGERINQNRTRIPTVRGGPVRAGSRSISRGGAR